MPERPLLPAPLPPHPLFHDLLRQALDGAIPPQPDLTHLLDRMETRR